MGKKLIHFVVLVVIAFAGMVGIRDVGWHTTDHEDPVKFCSHEIDLTPQDHQDCIRRMQKLVDQK
ncbi:hypothetical protein [Streptomyces sp. NPDC007172]|uniref:hypothetical protein n=1 Tax=Streptomyces sp. NPDC007172 TaxID=3364776 RepID=UPI00369A6DA8